jgi:RNA polymerase sigma-70 factor, ECF subfamily
VSATGISSMFTGLTGALARERFGFWPKVSTNGDAVGHTAAAGWTGAEPYCAIGRVQGTGKGLEQVFDADSSLVERCLSGDETAWEELVKVHTRRVYAICYRFTGRDSEAQDLAQDVFLRVFKSLGSFRAGEGSFVVWLTRLTRNLLIDHYRRTKGDRVTDSIEDQLPVLEEKTSLSMRADARVVGREASELLQQALGKLSPELRETVILRDLQEMEYREIAISLNVPEGTVKSRLNRGRTELARLLKRHAPAR